MEYSGCEQRWEGEDQVGGLGGKGTWWDYLKGGKYGYSLER